MADPTTSNVLLAVPTRGSDPGTWDIPMNGNSAGLDGFLGGVQTVSISNVPVTLTAPAGTVTATSGPTQAQNAVLKFTGTLTGNVQVTLPFPGYYIVENLIAVPTAFVLSFRAVGSGQVIATGPGSCRHIYNDGTNVKFVNLPDVGTYLDIANGTVPSWVTACTVPPYLNCDGSGFSAGTYPYLADLLGRTNTPDMRGVTRYGLNQGTSRITTAGTGLDGDTRFSIKGTQTLTLAITNLPTFTPAGTIINGNIVVSQNANNSNGSSATGGGAFPCVAPAGAIITASQAASTFTGTSVGSSTPFGLVATGMVSGITLIRAA